MCDGYLYPNVRMNPRFLQGAHPRLSSSSAYIRMYAKPHFVHYLKHFASHTRPRIQRPILLLIHNHASHVTIEDIQFFRDNRTAMLGFPPNTSHRLQSLDVGFYDPLKTAYSQDCDNFLVSSSCFCITVTYFSKIFCNAYLKVTTLQTAVNAFRATGIEPFESNIFRDEDFHPWLLIIKLSKTTNCHLSLNLGQNPHLRILILQYDLLLMILLQTSSLTL